MSAEDVYGFDYTFERKIAGLLISSATFATAASSGILVPGRIIDKICRYTISQALSHFQRTGQIADAPTIRQIAKDDERLTADQRKKICEFVGGLSAEQGGEKIVLEKLGAFMAHQGIMKLVLESADLLEVGKYEEIERRWKNLFDKSPLQRRITTTPFTERLRGALERQRFQNTVPTLIGDLDEYLLGHGLGQGDLGVFLAGTGVGKSTALAHVAKSGLLVLPSHNVLIVSFELSKEMYEWKVASSLGGLTYQEMSEFPMESEAAVRRKWRKRTDRLFIEHFFAHQIDVAELRMLVKRFIMETELPLGLLCLDYADLVDAGKDFEDLRAQRYVYEFLRGMAQEFEVPIWTGCQTNRAGLSKDRVTLKDISEGFGKAQTADIVCALCQSDAEKMRTPPEMRIFLAKNRNQLDGYEIRFKTNYARQQFSEVDGTTLLAEPEPDSDPAAWGTGVDDDDLPF